MASPLRRHAVDRQPAEAVAADHHVFSAQPVRLRELRHVAQQLAEGLQRVAVGVAFRPEAGQQIVNHIADGIADQRLARAAGAAK